ncbi:hypothetical protein H5410_011130 [Solanum commersonii]|uniref:Uncharacterized protein n=1 Tax=Solanum commersonii TaxID=4109 RepID=A0A9J6AMN3_SOLCO|nr:hypothetical protein H5410_011130 [Solanum commersonii]
MQGSGDQRIGERFIPEKQSQSQRIGQLAGNTNCVGEEEGNHNFLRSSSQVIITLGSALH